MSKNKHHIHEADYIGSFTSFDKVKFTDKPEYAFIGRSNVGKSSLINYLTDRKKLAKTSSTPGKTRTLNLFHIDGKWNILDLPGYGYARVSKKERQKFIEFIREYLDKRTNLVNVFILIDASISPQEIDLDFINWMGERQIPFSIVFTKTDKDKPKVIDENIDTFKDLLKASWEELPPLFMSSVNKREGREEILDFILELNDALN